MNKGDIVIFRCDFVHSGSGYDKENIRLHCYLDSKTVLRDPNRTFLIHKCANKKIAQLIIPKKIDK